VTLFSVWGGGGGKGKGSYQGSSDCFKVAGYSFFCYNVACAVTSAAATSEAVTLPGFGAHAHCAFRLERYRSRDHGPVVT